MTNDKYHDIILGIITEKGELGVNEISRLADLPLSTVQKYLERQKYFKKTERRKWDLPENVNADIKTDTMSLMVGSVENALLLVQAQMVELQESVQNSLVPVSTLKRGIDNLTPSVASKSHNIDPYIKSVLEMADVLYRIVKEKKSEIPEQYHDLLSNTNWTHIVACKGTIYTQDVISAGIADLIFKNDTTLSDEVVNMLKEYQK